MNENLLKNYVRPVREEDRAVLPVFSYSKMEVYKNCPYQYDLKYNQKKFTDDTSIALEIGGLLHYVLEQKGKALVSEQPIDYEKLNIIIQNGTKETNEKTKEQLLGITDLKKKYWEIWNIPDSEGRTYDQKLELFDKVLRSEMEEDDGWKPYQFEHYFEFVWGDRVIIKGFIDRLDLKDGNIRTIDYKTSKKVYDSSKLSTSLQFGIYALAILNEYGVLPVESIYRFILLDETQKALTKGWERRLIKALDGIFDKIDNDNESGVWVPKSSPLCYYCNFSKNNPSAHEYNNECEYYSLWRPDNKTFECNRKWNALENAVNTSKLNTKDTKRKLIF